MSDGSFKSPALPPGGLKSPGEVGHASPEKVKEPVKEEVEKKEKVSLSLKAPALSYLPPTWACEPSPSSGYRLEVLKDGCIVDTVNLDQRNNSTFITVGRLPSCDVILEHPSISRYHCVLQYGEDIMDRSGKGWHVFELGSTHGSKLNKKTIPAKQFIRIYVGHVLQFGGSTRIFNLIGPEDDVEKEWECSPTEMKEKMHRKALDAKLAAAAKKEFEEEKKRDEEDEGINWGMDYGEDDHAAPFMDMEGHGAEDGDEAYYSMDPKKALAKFFDREGFDMVFNYAEQGTGHTHKWICTIELPIEIDGIDRAFTAQAITTTNKKDAAVQCALEACKILDKYGVLRRGASKARLKRKTLAENDYYEEDDDLYLDRTGQLEKQKEKRKQWAMNAAGGSAPAKNTYETLCQQLEETKTSMERVKKELDSLGHAIPNKGLESSDSLDDYCRQLAAGGIKDDLKTKTQKSMLRQELVKLTHESQKLEKLCKIAKPSCLPTLKASTSADANKQDFMKKMAALQKKKREEEAAQKDEQPHAALKGPFKPSTDEKDLFSDPKAEKQPFLNPKAEKEPDFRPEVESEDKEEDKQQQQQVVKTAEPEAPKVQQKEEPQPPKSVPEPVKSNLPLTKEPETANTSKRPLEEAPEVEPEVEIEPEVVPAKKKRVRIRKDKEPAEYGVGCEAKDEQYATWLPPDNQSGDGKTKLHEKFGGRY